MLRFEIVQTDIAKLKADFLTIRVATGDEMENLLQATLLASLVSGFAFLAVTAHAETSCVVGGASDMSVPADVVSTLIRTKTITDQECLGQHTYVLADGSKVPSQQFRIRSLKVGNKTVENVVASIASVNGEILLGQSFLSKFKSWSVDNEAHTLDLR